MRALSLFLCLCVRLYQLTLRPVIGSHCRHEPTCSDYALEALLVYGPFKGILLIGWRILRCNPWSKVCYDPVPYSNPNLCTHPHYNGNERKLFTQHINKVSSYPFPLPHSSDVSFSKDSQAYGNSKQVIC